MESRFFFSSTFSYERSTWEYFSMIKSSSWSEEAEMNSWIGNFSPFLIFLLLEAPFKLWPTLSLRGEYELPFWSLLSIKEIRARLTSFYLRPLLDSRKLFCESFCKEFETFLLLYLDSWSVCSQVSNGVNLFLFLPPKFDLGNFSGSSSICLTNSGVCSTSILFCCFILPRSIFYYESLTAYSCFNFLWVWIKLSLDDKLFEPLFSAESVPELGFL